MKTHTNYVAYYRVSTHKQGIAGLGIEAQKADVLRFTRGHISAEYTEVESGKHDKRPQLLLALEHCARHNATLVIAKLDRLSRNVSFIETLRSNGVKFVCCDMPEANELVIGIMAQMAQFERKQTSARTKAALQVLKDKGVKLGGSSRAHCDSMRAKRKPVEYDKAIKYMIQTERDKGHTFEAIAFTLSINGYLTNRKKEFTPTAVYRIYHTL